MTILRKKYSQTQGNNNIHKYYYYLKKFEGRWQNLNPLFLKGDEIVGSCEMTQQVRPCLTSQELTLIVFLFFSLLSCVSDP